MITSAKGDCVFDRVGLSVCMSVSGIIQSNEYPK